MYQRSRAVAVAGRLRPAVGVRGWAWGVGGPRWGQAEALGCCGRARHQDPAPRGGAACRALGSPRPPAVKYHSLLVGRRVEAAGFPFLPAPEREEAAATAPEQKRSRSLLPPRLKQRRCLWPATACLLQGLEGPVTMVDGRREDDIAVRDDEGLDGLSLDSLRSLFDSRPCRIPYQAFEASVLLVPFQAAPGPAPGAATSGSPKSSDPSMEEHLAIMYERLHHELPNFFLKKQNYQIYSEDVEFINEILHMRTRGRIIYQLLLILCRFVAWNYFANLRMEVLKLTQHPENWSIQARWRITGLPFHIFMLHFYKKDKKELYRTYDAYSTFFLNSQGLIRCHKIDKLMPSQPPLNKVKKLLVTALVALGLSEHKPSLQLLLSALAGKQQS
ncbi:uncharacterized protein C6orf136 homolog [Alligator mississippiensis]|nr:uncharacterized protein C6orf136 homolog [Alligator mississippiensis]